MVLHQEHFFFFLVHVFATAKYSRRYPKVIDLPGAVEETLARAATFGHAIGIEPKSRGALPIAATFPAVVAARAHKNKTKQQQKRKDFYQIHQAAKSYKLHEEAFRIVPRRHILLP